MKKMFLVSSFTPVADFLPAFLGEEMQGKKISFITTASVVKKSKFYVKWAKEKLASFGLIVDEVEVGSMNYETVKTALETNDYIFVCGGNPFYLLDELERTGTMQLLIDQIKAGKPYIGESSGAIILASNIAYCEPLTGPETVEMPQSLDGLNLLDFKVVPHYQTFPFTKTVDEILANNFSKTKFVPITNNQAILINNDRYEIKTAFRNEAKKL